MVPYYLEQLIHQGKAEFKSYSGFAAQNHIIKVPESTYIIIYEYWYKPQLSWDTSEVQVPEALSDINYRDLVSYAHFFTGNKYHPFFHKPIIAPTTGKFLNSFSPDRSPLDLTVQFSGINTDYRKCYIGSSRDVSVYFTRLVNQDVIYTPVVVNPINSFQSGLGYAGQAIAGRITRFNAGNNTHYGPLQQPYSQIGGLTSIEYNQAFTIPNGNGDLQQPETIGSIGAQKQLRQLFFHCNYIQVNEPAPKTLI